MEKFWTNMRFNNKYFKNTLNSSKKEEFLSKFFDDLTCDHSKIFLYNDDNFLKGCSKNGLVLSIAVNLSFKNQNYFVMSPYFKLQISTEYCCLQF
ncbi:hypothetical protein BpHYR1_017287 [Brachionus plicatilis]|uniref:Uncharacterized protein n=1 Tax=Brachionus plicatilis TaxID=10195 RepID=A0A3M7PA17_BRAPC|nr:hypothetical protein BpHYR1_017287 [Brachionus plicatilis]